MNMGIVTTFVIAGLLMVSILTLNSRVMINSSKTTADLVNKKKMETLRQLIENDFSRIGFGNDAEIEIFSPVKIQFKADIEGNGTKIVIWHAKDDTPSTNTTNPNDYKLLRIIKNKSGTSTESEVEFNIVDFKVTAYDEITNGNPTTQTEDIESFLIEVVYESAEPTGEDSDGNDIYTTSRWRKYIVPSNLQFETKLK